MTWITEPFGYGFMQDALVTGLLAALVCAVVGTWVVVRGIAFIGDAMAHGVVPGVAIAFQVGANLVVGAVASAAVMALGITLVARRRRVGDDTAIGLLFVGMLALGVIVMSRSSGYAGELTAMLFGNPLGVDDGDIVLLAVAAVASIVLAVTFHRSLLALAFNSRKAEALGLRPRLAHGVLLAMVTVAVVASFQAIGTLMVFGLLIAPPAAASLFTRSVHSMMVVAAAVGCASAFVGLMVSYHHDLAAGASIAAAAVVAFFVAFVARGVLDALAPRRVVQT